MVDPHKRDQPLPVSNPDDEDYIPLPPDNFDSWSLPLVKMDDIQGTWFRCHGFSRNYSPVAYNHRVIRDRFNAPNGEYGVLYMGCDEHCAFIESYGPDIAEGDYRILNEAKLQERCICEISVIPEAPPLHLVNLADGYGLSRLGLDSRISTTARRGITRQWALSLWKHPSKPDGILYTARHDPKRLSIVIFDRAGEIFVPNCNQNVLRDERHLGSILDYYYVGLIPGATNSHRSSHN